MEKGETRTAAKKDEAKEGGYSLLPKKAYDEIVKWEEAIREHPYAAKLLAADGPVEQSGFWMDTEHNVLCKTRPDKRIPSLKTVIDVKTWSLSKQSSPDMDYLWNKEIANRSYHIQAAHNLEGCSILDDIEYETFVWIVVVKEPPYFVGTWETSHERIVVDDEGNQTIEKDEMLEIARHMIAGAKETYARCMESGEWPKPDFPGIRKAHLPKWATERWL
jgi:exodeoxyribonuclease VIII